MKYLETFYEFNGSNLTLDNNPTQVKFDGGDGASGTEVPYKYHNIKTPTKSEKGNNARKQQEERRKRRKSLSKDYRNAKMSDYQTDDDLIKTGMPIKQPTVNAGGAT